MQVAVAFGKQPGHDSEAMHFIDVAMTHGWPGDSRDVQQLNAEIARRAGHYAEAAEYQAMTLPAATRQAEERRWCSCCTLRSPILPGGAPPSPHSTR